MTLMAAFGHVGKRTQAGIAGDVLANKFLSSLQVITSVKVIQDKGLLIRWSRVRISPDPPNILCGTSN